jgi:long-chain fatty acid transport protein
MRVWKLHYFLGAWLMLAGMAFADGVILDGASPRSIGRGGTDIAHSDTVGLLLDNPAGAVNIEGNNLFEVGMNMMFTDFGYADPARSGTTSEFTPLPEVGLIKKSQDGQWAYGLGVFAPADLIQPDESGFSSDRGTVPAPLERHAIDSIGL